MWILYPLSEFLLVLLSPFFIKETYAHASMSIDLGTEFMKIAVVSPGLPMEIVLNTESKRKTSTAIGFKDGERFFDSVALQLAARYPDLVYQSILSIIGKPIDHPAVSLFRERYRYHNMSYDEKTGEIVFDHKGHMNLSTDELVAMLFEYARKIASQATGTDITTCVLTVPSFYGHSERFHLKRAAELSGLEVLQLLNDNTAVALNFFLPRYKTFNETSRYFLFYDVGSQSTSATLVAYSYGQYKEGSISDNFPILKVVRVGHDPSLGTTSFAICIRNKLAEHFNAIKTAYEGDIFLNDKAMSKLTQEAMNVLTRLSANTAYYAQVENLAGGEDFSLTVTRVQMEMWCADLFNRLKSPFDEVVTNFSENIEDLVLMGGGTRIPKVQTILMELSQRSTLNRGVNTDEAAVLGAVYLSAFHTPGFRVTRFIIKDYNPYPIGVDFMRAPHSTNETSSTLDLSPLVRQELFPRGATIPQRRSIKFNRHYDDFDFFVNYINLKDSESKTLGTHLNLSYVVTKNVSETLKQYLNTEAGGIKAYFSLNVNGLLELTGIECLLYPGTNDVADEASEKSTLEKIGQTLSGIFSSGIKGETPEGVQLNQNGSESVEAHSNTTITTTADNITSNHSSPLRNKTIDTPKQKSPFSKPIEYESTQLFTPVIPPSATQYSKQKLHNFRKVDETKRQLENSVNSLEALIIDIRENLDGEYSKFSKAADIGHISSILTSISEWFDEEGHNALKTEYDSRRIQLEQAIEPILSRIHEYHNRPAAFTNATHTVNEAQSLLKQIEQMQKYQDEFSQAQIDLPKGIFHNSEFKVFGDMINSTEKWLNESSSLMTDLELDTDPPISVAQIKAKDRELKRETSSMSSKLYVWRTELSRLLASLSTQSTPSTNSTTLHPDAESTSSTDDTTTPRSEL